MLEVFRLLFNFFDLRFLIAINILFQSFDFKFQLRNLGSCFTFYLASCRVLNNAVFLDLLLILDL